MTSGVTLKDVLQDDATLDAYLNKSVVGVWHPVGTCRMGRASDPMAVTGASGLMHKSAGTSGLRRLGDADDPCANTNIPTIMVAERMADLIKAEQTQNLRQAG